MKKSKHSRSKTSKSAEFILLIIWVLGGTVYLLVQTYLLGKEFSNVSLLYYCFVAHVLFAFVQRQRLEVLIEKQRKLLKAYAYRADGPDLRLLLEDLERSDEDK